jgi:hypothetical protein
VFLPVDPPGGGGGGGGGRRIGPARPDPRPAPRPDPLSPPHGAPPWQEWGSFPPWLAGGPPGFGLPCDFGVCNPILNSFLGTGFPGTGSVTIDILVLAPFLQGGSGLCPEGLTSCMKKCQWNYVFCQLGEGSAGVDCLIFGPSPLRHGGQSCGPTSFGPDVCLHNRGWCQLGCESRCVGPYPPTILPPPIGPPYRPGSWF